MVDVIGTTGADTLTGTGSGMLSGGAGGDLYDPRGGSGLRSYVIHDQGGDGVDLVLGNLFWSRRYIDLDTYSPSDYMGLGFAGMAGWADMARVGDDLVIQLPAKPSAWRVVGHSPVTVTITGQYGEAGRIEVFRWGATDFALMQGAVGTDGNDIFAGTGLADGVYLGAGTNMAWLGLGNDTATGGAGNDTMFGGAGDDLIQLGAGANEAFGGEGQDRITGGSGVDWAFAGAGNDTISAGSGNDWVDGETGDDLVKAGSGLDELAGGGGNDTLIGGMGGDTYRFDDQKVGALEGWGHDVIRDQGDATWDTIEFWGFSGPSYTGAALSERLTLDRVGNTGILVIDGGQMSIAIEGQCGSGAGAVIEEIKIFNGYWTPWYLQLRSVDRDPVSDERPTGNYNEIIFGSDRADTIYTDAGLNLVWLGGGADRMLYKESDASTGGLPTGGGAVSDVISDFDATEDVLDFTEIKTLGMEDLVFGAAGDGSVTIGWASGSIEVSSISIWLRGVEAVDLTADNFAFF